MLNRVYESEKEVAEAWSKVYRQQSRTYEYAAMIYRTQIKGEQKYFYRFTGRGARTMRYMRAHVIMPFLYLYCIESWVMRVLYHASPVAFIHSHPCPPTGYTLNNHSKEDLALLKLPGIKGVYVIPYEDLSINRKGR